MGLEVLQRSSTANLIALATVRLRLLGDAADTTKDAILTDLIATASDAMQAYARPFGRQQYRWTTGGNHRQRLVLPVFPVDSDSIAIEELDEPGDAPGTGETVTEWFVEDAAAGILFLRTGWPGSLGGITEAPEPTLVVTFKAGWILPDQITTWDGLQTWVVGEWVRPTAPNLSRFLFEVTTAGADGATEPTWSTADEAGDTIADGVAVHTARDAVELPKIASDHCYREIVARYDTLQISESIKRLKSGNTDFERFQGGGFMHDLQPSTMYWLNSQFGMAA